MAEYAEYIERYALIKRLCERCNEEMSESPCEPSDCFVREVIKTIPAADVAPVRHARWVDNHCTACGMMPMGDEMWKHLDLEPPLFERFMDYCPICGCRMDG